MRKIIILSICILSAFSSHGQASFKNYLKKGKQAIKENNFSGAVELLSEAVAREPLHKEAVSLLAESARKAYAYSIAENNYQILVDSLGIEDQPKSLLYLAELKNILGKYSEAVTYYDLYLSEYEELSAQDSRAAKKGRKSARWAAEQPPADPDKALVMHLDESVNTGYSEHAPFLRDDNLYYTSLRYQKPNDTYKPKRYVSKVLVSDNELEGELMPLTGNFNSNKVLTSGTSLTKDGKIMLLSICNFTELNQIQCQLYYRTLQDTLWSEPVKLPESINLKKYTSTHPAIGEQNDEKTVLYFVSNRPGGKGGMDIWQTTFSNEMEFAEPSRLKINTEYDEVSPHFFEAKNELYFSSTGRDGFGGFDIYRSPAKGNIDDEAIENVGPEVNSSFNDLYYALSYRGDKAYYSSNRPGSFYLIEKFETCCYDIYRADLDECYLNLLALTFDGLTEEELNGVTIKIEDIDAPLEEPREFTNLEGNDFLVDVDCKGKYKITASKEDYDPAIIELFMEDQELEDGKPVEHKIKLFPSELPLIVYAFDKLTEQPLSGVKVTLVDVVTDQNEYRSNPNGNDFSFSVLPPKEYIILGTKDGYIEDRVDLVANREEGDSLIRRIYLEKSDIVLKAVTMEKATRERLGGATVKLIDMESGTVLKEIKANPLSEFTFEVRTGREYQLVGSKDGYDDYQLTFTVPRGINELEKELPLGRVAEIITLSKLIPMKLYFDNDEPDPKTTKTTTAKRFARAFNDYYTRKGTYLKSYLSLFSSNEKPGAKQEVESFFNDEVKGGFNTITIFLETLHRVLQSGKTTNIYLRGYASPVAQSDYNEALGKRRVDCIRKEFYSYDNGILVPFINSGQLIITERSFGEGTAPTGVSDDPSAPGRAVYSPNAARERRVEIDEIKEVNN